MSSSLSLGAFKKCLYSIPDPRPFRGVSHDFQTIMGIVFLGLLANYSTLAEIERWAKRHFDEFQQILRFRARRVPHAITLARMLARLSLKDLQNVFAEFINTVLESQTIVAAVFGTRYFVSSLDPAEVSASMFQELVLRHWEVENCLHLQKDRYFDEDKHVFRRPGLGEAWTVLTNMALSLTRLLHRGERTLREVHEQCLRAGAENWARYWYLVFW